MWQVGSIAFLNPWALAALVALPIIWWLLRFTPPRPDRIDFPPFRFLLELVSSEETPHKTPWWLIALRLSAAGLLIVALAQPVLNKTLPISAGKGPLLVVVDDGWASAKDWQRRMNVLQEIVEAAEQNARLISIQTTTPRLAPRPLEPKEAREVAGLMSALQPQPLTPDRQKLASLLTPAFKDSEGVNVTWLSDGLDYGTARAFAETLKALGNGAEVSVLAPPAVEVSHALGAVSLEDGNLTVSVNRADKIGAAKGTINAVALNGRVLGNVEYGFAADSAEAKATLDLPVALRNEVARLFISDARSAASMFLLDDSWRRKTVGLVSGKSLYFAQPLLSPLYYVSRALEPFTELKRAPIDDGDSGIKALLDGGLSMLVLADVGQLQESDRIAVEDWVDNGGTLVRFAGPRLAARQDELVPVKLRRGGRALSGALSWASPQPLSPFDEGSPFYGLPVPEDVTVVRQVLAEPGSELNQKTWARLGDNTPLVTASRVGAGSIVLFHVTASPEWSNLPLSGLFLDMLRRLVARSQGVSGEGQQATFNASGAFAPVRVLNGYGELASPPADAAPVPAKDIRTAKPAPEHLPGLYRRGGQTHSINLAGGGLKFSALGSLPLGISQGGYTKTPALSLKPWLLTAAFILLLADALASLWLAGRLARRGGLTAAVSLILFVVAAQMFGAPASAQDSTSGVSVADRFAMQATLQTRLAFVLTGNARMDEVSRTGLYGLSDYIRRKTSLEPEAPVGVDIEKDEIVLFPLLYWPVHRDAQALSKVGAAKLAAFLKSGGTIFFDTRDHQDALAGVTSEGPARQALRRILAGLDIPPLETVPPDHVLTKAFYLLNRFPGRWAGGKLWVEATDRASTGITSNTDGVSSVIIGANDYAAAWATDPTGRALYPTIPGGKRQREFAFRTGVNIVMYSLTGNYKADQVHVPSILERIGQ
ncbi:MAG: DUF4159 domain-containing protein [Alphaproteobacteria bacterium]|nr:DUF4159 domain-containing protein [Alphaproteobacteria bacterium]